VNGEVSREVVVGRCRVGVDKGESCSAFGVMESARKLVTRVIQK